MKDRDSGMFVIHDDVHDWTAFVICTILPDDSGLLANDEGREHGWYGEGATEVDAIEELQSIMRAA